MNDPNTVVATTQGSLQLLTGSPSLSQSEDNCLTLNIWTLASPASAVLCWCGSTAPAGSAAPAPGPAITAANLAAAEDIVVVTPNYRLGPAGLPARPRRRRGNVGFLDAVAALRWARENIADFGDDPDRVTVAGQSGGAVTAVALLTSPSASDLFRRIFAQSGPIGIPMPSPQEAEQTGGRELAEQAERCAKVSPQWLPAWHRPPRC